MIFTATELLASIKTRALVPSSQTTFADTDLLDLANEEMEQFMAGYLIRVKEEYLIHTEDITLIANEDHYRIPERAIGLKLRDIVYKDSNGNRSRIPRLDREDLPEYPSNATDSPVGFYLESNDIVLLPMPRTTAGTLEVSYYRRPGKIVAASRYTTILSTSGQNLIVANSVPANMAVGGFIDIITNKSGSETVVHGLEITAIVGTTITVSGDVTNVAAGHYVCSEKEAPMPQCPEEMHPLLAQRVACRLLEALNDTEGLQNASVKLLEMEKNLTSLIDSRVEGKPQKIVNRRGLLMGASRWPSRYSRY